MNKYIVLSVTGMLVACSCGVAMGEPIAGGLWGKYYDGAEYKGKAPKFTDLKYEQVDSTIDFTWDTGSPDQTLLGTDYYSIDWQGWLYVEKEGNYNFQTYSDDSSVLSINDDIVVDNSGAHSPTYASGDVYLTAGFNKLDLTYSEGTGISTVSLLWEQNGTYEVIDSSHLYYGDLNSSEVPEPATMALLGIGLVGIVGLSRKRR